MPFDSPERHEPPRCLSRGNVLLNPSCELSGRDIGRDVHGLIAKRWIGPELRLLELFMHRVDQIGKVDGLGQHGDVRGAKASARTALQISGEIDFAYPDLPPYDDSLYEPMPKVDIDPED